VAPFGIPTPAERLETALFAPSIQDHTDHVAAHVGTQPLDVRNPEGVLQILERVSYQLGFGSTGGPLPTGSIFKFPIGEAQRGEEVVEPRQDIMSSIMPAVGTGFESFVIAFFGLLDQTFQAHIAADLPLPETPAAKPFPVEVAVC
jgi:hypothetical protein